MSTRPTCTATPPPRRSRGSGVQRALGLPECATPPQEVYELAKRRGMDFVTITDHDTIDGALEIADLPDTFISEELTAQLPRRAAGRARALLRHHARATTSGSQAHAGDVEECAEYLEASGIVSALAHPFYAVARAAAQPPPPPPRGAVPDLGDAQRLARRAS